MIPTERKTWGNREKNPEEWQFPMPYPKMFIPHQITPHLARPLMTCGRSWGCKKAFRLRRRFADKSLTIVDHSPSICQLFWVKGFATLPFPPPSPPPLFRPSFCVNRRQEALQTILKVSSRLEIFPFLVRLRPIQVFETD